MASKPVIFNTHGWGENDAEEEESCGRDGEVLWAESFWWDVSSTPMLFGNLCHKQKAFS